MTYTHLNEGINGKNSLKHTCKSYDTYHLNIHKKHYKNLIIIAILSCDLYNLKTSLYFI